MRFAAILPVALVLAIAQAAWAQETFVIPCHRVDDFIRGRVEIPAGAKVAVQALTWEYLYSQPGGPERVAELLRIPEGRAALEARHVISEEEYKWCQQRVQSELKRRANELGRPYP